LAQQCGIELGTERQVDAQWIDDQRRLDAGALEHAVHQRRVELGLSEDALHAEIGDTLLDLSDTRRARVRCIPQGDRPGRWHIEAALEVLVGIVEDDEARTLGLLEAGLQFIDQVVELAAGFLCVVSIDVGVVGIEFGQ